LEDQFLLNREINTETIRNNVPKSNDWVQNCLFNYNESEFRKTLRMDKKNFLDSKVNTGFEQIQGFPMVIGAIDGSHILLYEAPSKDNKDVYMSRKQKYGIHLQGVVDHQ
ncbi:5762_t:CDS:2, partial [Racocetra persica]